jgi:cholesterol oxidase
MAATALEVTEWMKGYLGTGATDYDAGFIKGIQSKAFFVHEMLIQIDDVDRFVADPEHTASMNGYVSFDAFGGKRPVTNASFKMFVDAGQGLKYMKYRMPFTTDKNQPLTLYGHKTIHNDGSLDLWSDTTTLYTSVFEGNLTTPEPPTSPALAMGIIHIEKLDLIKSVMSFRTPGASPAEATRARVTFGRFFLGNLWDTYGHFTELAPQGA